MVSTVLACIMISHVSSFTIMLRLLCLVVEYL